MRLRLQHALEGFWAATWAQRKDIFRRAYRRGLASLPPVLASQWLLIRGDISGDLNDAAAGFQGWLEWVPISRATLGPVTLVVFTAFIVGFGTALIDLCTAVPRQRSRQRKELLRALANDPALYERIQGEIEGGSPEPSGSNEEVGDG